MHVTAAHAAAAGSPASSHWPSWARKIGVGSFSVESKGTDEGNVSGTLGIAVEDTSMSGCFCVNDEEDADEAAEPGAAAATGDPTADPGEENGDDDGEEEEDPWRDARSGEAGVEPVRRVQLAMWSSHSLL